MLRKFIPVFLASATFSLFFSGCGAVECVECAGGSGAAVLCYVGVGKPQEMCGPDQATAAASCLEVGGSWSPVDGCEGEVYETEDDPGGVPGDDPGSDPWDPSLDVTFDRDTGEYIIDQIAFEELKLDPARLTRDSTELRELESGHFQLVNPGELSDALGWRAGDIALSVDGYNLGGLAAFATAYTDLADNSRFGLVMQRGPHEVVLRYRIE